MSLKFEGLTEFQKDLLEVAQEKLPSETNKMMRKAGNRLTTYARREARSAIDHTSGTGNYYRGFKRGKVFKDREGKTVVRAINSAPHAHLLEYGFRLVRGGREIGFVPGRLIMDAAAKKFDNSGEFEKIISDELDRMLREQGL